MLYKSRDIMRSRAKKLKQKSVPESNNSVDIYIILVMILGVECLRGIEMSNPQKLRVLLPTHYKKHSFHTLHFF